MQVVSIAEEMLALRAREAIWHLGYVKLRSMVCLCQSQTITVTGVADCFFMKQLVLSAVSKTIGVEHVIDRIIVHYA